MTLEVETDASGYAIGGVLGSDSKQRNLIFQEKSFQPKLDRKLTW